jgi:hypothetical protein
VVDDGTVPEPPASGSEPAPSIDRCVVVRWWDDPRDRKDQRDLEYRTPVVGMSLAHIVLERQQAIELMEWIDRQCRDLSQSR